MADFKAMLRIVTFVPPDQVEKVIEGVQKITPLKYGKYAGVAWQSTPGIKRYQPLSGSNPTAGKENEVSREPSVKLEFSIPRSPLLLKRVINEGIIPNHPWEEPVILVFEVRETRTQT